MKATTPTSTTPTDIRPFEFEVTDEELRDLRDRIKATKWPDEEVDPSQGVHLKTMQELGRLLGDDYDWRKFEERFAPCPTSSPRSTGWTSISSTSAPSMTTRCP